MYTARQLIHRLCTAKKKKLSGYWAPDINTNRISRRINKLSENLTSLSIFTLKYKTNITYPSLSSTNFRLRSKQRKY